MCYIRKYPCQAKHSNFVFVSAASPTSTTLRMTFKTAASAFYSRARYHSDARIPSGEMMEEVRSDTARSSKLLKIEIRISLHVSQNNASSMPVTLVVSVILDLDRPRRGVIRENVAPLENLRLTLREQFAACIVSESRGQRLVSKW